MGPLHHGPNRLAKLAVVNSGGQVIALSRPAKVDHQVEVDFEGLGPHRFLREGPVGGHEAKAAQLNTVLICTVPLFAGYVGRGILTAVLAGPLLNGLRQCQAPAVWATAPALGTAEPGTMGFARSGTKATSSRPSGPICRPKSRSTTATACAPSWIMVLQYR